MTSEHLVPREVEFAYVLVADDQLNLIAHHVSEVVAAALDAGGDVVAFDASLQFITFEAGAGDPDTAQQRRTAFLQALDATAARSARVVYGRRRALVGDLGVRGRRLSSSLVFTGCGECLSVLANLSPGSRKEV